MKTLVKQLDSKITDVTIFTDRAEITRIASNEFEKGNHEVKIMNLPEDLIDESVRVLGKGTAKAKICGVKIETEYTENVTKEELIQLDEQLKENILKIENIDDRINTINKEIQFLDQIRNVTTSPVIYGKSEGEKSFPTIEDWTSLLSFYENKNDSLHKELRELKTKKTEMESLIDYLKKNISKLSSHKKKSSKSVTIEILINKSGTLDLNILYTIEGASWHSLYDVRVSKEDKNVEFFYYGVISQETGEDWEDVNIKLSTANPSISQTVPEMNKWELKEIEIDYLRSKNRNIPAAPRMKAAPLPESDDDMTTEYEGYNEILDAAPAVATVEENGISVNFNIPRKESVPSDGSDHITAIAIENLEADFQYIAVPKLKLFAFLTGKIINTTKQPFLEGDINIFWGNNFIGNAYIDTIVPGDSFDVSLGIDEQIKIYREQLTDKKGEIGIFSKSIEKRFSYKIMVENLKTTNEKIVIKDQVPVSTSDKIEVKVIEPNFEKTKDCLLEPDGTIIWSSDLSAHEQKEFFLKFNVEYPKELPVEGF